MANFLKSLFVKGVEIDTTGASTGNVLSYNGTKFAPAAPGSGSLALDDLSDVVVTSPEEFQGLSYNGTSWVNSHIPLVSYVRNAESTTITTGTCVYLFGATGDHATVKRADNNNDSTSSKTIGVAGADITASNEGPIVTRGYVDGIDLSVGYTAGDVLWLGENGAFTTTKPTAPDHLVFIGVVVRATNNGIIYVATQNGYELDELHNVSLPSPNSGEFLKYNGSLWVADAIDLGTDTTGNYMSGISGTSPVSVSHTPSEGSSATVSLASGYGDTQNPYGSKTANYFLASPNGSAGVPEFRAIAAADVPTLNQNTTGTASNITASSNTTITSLSNLVTVGTITSGTWSGSFGSVSGENLTSLNASNLGSGTVPSARISGSYTGITAVGTLSSGSIPATLLTGTVASARLSGSYTGITGLGTLTSLTIDGTSSPSMSIGDWNQDGNWAGIRGTFGYLLTGSNGAGNAGVYLRTESTTHPVFIGSNNTNTLRVDNTSATVSGTMNATTFSGSGSSLTSLNASNLASGTVPSARVTGAYTSGITNMTVGNATTNNSTLNVLGGTAWFSAMGTGTGSTVINTFGFLAYVSSRREIKENITTIDANTALSRICALRPVDYTLKPEFVMNPSELTSIDYKRGFIAQEVAEVDHWYGQWGWVDEDQKMVTEQALAGELPLEDATPIYWNHDAMIADLVASVQNLANRLQVLESQ